MSGSVRRHLRCRVCGSRRLVPMRTSGPLRYEITTGAALLQWQCRACRTSTVRGQARGAGELLWRRRRPLATWLFGTL